MGGGARRIRRDHGGLDAGRAEAQLDRLAPAATAEADARARAADLRLEPAGAVDAIVAALG